MFTTVMATRQSILKLPLRSQTMKITRTDKSGYKKSYSDAEGSSSMPQYGLDYSTNGMII